VIKLFSSKIVFCILFCCLITSLGYSDENRQGTIYLRNGKTIDFYKIDQPIGIQGKLDGAPINIEFKYLNKIVLIDDKLYECRSNRQGELLVFKRKDNNQFAINDAIFCHDDLEHCSCGGDKTGKIHYTTYNPISEVSEKQRVNVKEIAALIIVSPTFNARF